MYIFQASKAEILVQFHFRLADSFIEINELQQPNRRENKKGKAVSVLSLLPYDTPLVKHRYGQ